jgi:chromosome partitioning protein
MSHGASMRKIAIANMKGGVGKTTTAIHLASGLARRGWHVLLVDVDPQANSTFALGVRAARTLRHVMLGDATAADAIVRDLIPGLDVLASDHGCFGLETQLSATMQRETVLARRLEGLQGYHAVVIDSSPAMGLLTYNALLAASEVVLPVTMDALAVIGARETLRGIREIRRLWPDRALSLAAVLPTNVQANRVATRAAMAALEEDPEIAAALVRPGIRQCADLVHAMAARQPVFEFAPRSRAAEEYDQFVDRLSGERRGDGESNAFIAETSPPVF